MSISLNYLRHLLYILLMVMPISAQAQQSATDVLLDEVRARIPNIGTDELKSRLSENPDIYLIDVRTVRETDIVGGTIDAKRNIIIPRGWLEFRIGDAVADKSAPIVVYCGTNRRSPFAVETLQRMGYTNVVNYSDGYPGWRNAGLPIETTDAAKNSFLYSKPIEVISGVWSAIGATAPSTYQNSGHNNNLSFVVTGDGVLVFNAGGSYLLALAMHEEIKKITDQPVKYVVLENGQGHAALGTGYWQEQGVPVIAHEDAAEEFEELAEEILDSARRRLEDKAFGTEIALPDETFADQKIFEMGGRHIELIKLGPAHSPGDIMLWMPEEKLIITGDMAFHERMLPVFEHTDTAGWLETWEDFAALGAEHVIPGHGGPTDMAEVTKYTRDYLTYMRSEIQKILDADGDEQQAYKIDQSAYEHLDTYEFLALQNAGRIYRSMEFE